MPTFPITWEFFFFIFFLSHLKVIMFCCKSPQINIDALTLILVIMSFIDNIIALFLWKKKKMS